jgi:hypothetical protein
VARETFSELRKLRNEIAHGRFSANALARRFTELGLSIPTDDISALTHALLAAFSSPAGRVRDPSRQPGDVCCDNVAIEICARYGRIHDLSTTSALSAPLGGRFWITLGGTVTGRAVGVHRSD